MNYNLEFEPDAVAELREIAPAMRTRLLEKIDWLLANCDRIPHQSLTGYWQGCSRLRVGDYRVVYKLDEENQTLAILKVGHRRDIYKA